MFKMQWFSSVKINYSEDDFKSIRKAKLRIYIYENNYNNTSTVCHQV